MRINPNFHKRKSFHRQGYDYSRVGSYFVTCNLKDRECLFGEIIDGIMYRNDAGEMVHQQWQKLTERFPNIELDEFIVMPDHFHGIINIVGATTNGNQTELDVERPQGSPPRSITQKTVSDFLDAFKSITTVEYIRGIKKSGWKPFNRKLWQRDFFDRIIRTAQSYKNISKYISENPAKWRGPTP